MRQVYNTDLSSNLQRVLLAALCACFVVLGWPFLTRLGIEVDEALVGSGIYQRAAVASSWRFGEVRIPVMVLSYLGALKTWVCAGLFALWEPNQLTVRLPSVTAGAATIWMFFALLVRVAGRHAAWLGAALLAVDPSFVLSDAIDFGPVAFSICLKVAALLLIVRFVQDGGVGNVAGAGFVLGLAIWDKAIFGWVLVGLLVAAGVVYPREVGSRLNRKVIAAGSAAFLIGALPLVLYNLERPLETLRSNAKYSSANFAVKKHLLRQTLDGAGLFGFYTADAPGPRPSVEDGVWQRSSMAVYRALGPIWTNWNEPAWLLSLAAIPLLWRTPARRLLLFSLVFLMVTWTQMMFTENAGGAVHHVILLWPFPQAMIAIGFAAVAARWRWGVAALAVLGVLLCGRDLLVMNQYYAHLLTQGTTVRWTDAFPRLLRSLEASQSKHVYVADWGILETVNLLSEGRVPVIAVDPGQAPGDATDIYVTHPGVYALMPAIDIGLRAAAARAGFSREVIETVYDHQGRGVFEIFRYRRNGG